MTLCRAQHKNNYTVINNTIITDKRLSWKAKGIWLYAFSRMDNWEFRVSNIVDQSTDGKDSVYSGLKELEEFGYLERKWIKGENGQFTNYEYIFHETPILKEKLPQRENPETEKAERENPSLISTEEKINTKKDTLSISPKENRNRERERAIEEQTEQIMSFTFNDLPDTIPEEKRKIPFSKENIKKALRKYGLDLVTCVLSSFCKLKPKERNSLGAGYFFSELKSLKESYE